MLICPKCECYKECKANEYKHPIYKTTLPVFDYALWRARELYNNMKVGWKYSKTDMEEESNKVVILLNVFTSAVNDHSMKQFQSNNKGE